MNLPPDPFLPPGCTQSDLDRAHEGSTGGGSPHYAGGPKLTQEQLAARLEALDDALRPIEDYLASQTDDRATACLVRLRAAWRAGTPSTPTRSQRLGHVLKNLIGCAEIQLRVIDRSHARELAMDMLRHAIREAREEMER